jgi:hypothetical protein
MSRSSASAEVLWDHNDTIVEIRGLENEVTGESINDATVTCTLYDAEDAEVTGQSWPLSLTYVTSSAGVYRATLPYGIGIVPASGYTLQVDVDAGAGLRGQWRIPCVCRVRT